MNLPEYSIDDPAAIEIVERVESILEEILSKYGISNGGQKGNLFRGKKYVHGSFEFEQWGTTKSANNFSSTRVSIEGEIIYLRNGPKVKLASKEFFTHLDEFHHKLCPYIKVEHEPDQGDMW